MTFTRTKNTYYISKKKAEALECKQKKSEKERNTKKKSHGSKSACGLPYVNYLIDQVPIASLDSYTV
jgi:hypothetical protein